MKNKNKNTRAENQRIIREYFEEFYFRFIELSKDERQKEMKMFDEAIEFFADNPRIREYFENLKNAFQNLEVEN